MSDERRGGDIAIARYVPPVSVPDMERMAHAIVASGLFGVRTVPQALTLMWLAQAEGRHPVLAARDYHIIEGRPSKTAEAMMRDFLAARGAVEWHQLDDSAADATFSHPHGGEVRIRWDMDRARKAGLLGRKGDMWAKYPRQMLRSRCVSEGIRTVGPMATSGLYVPEEVGDYEPRQRRSMKDVTPTGSTPAEPPSDPDTGEVSGPDDLHLLDKVALEAGAQEAASRGRAALREHLRHLSRQERDLLRDAVGSAGEPGPLLAEAERVDAAAAQAATAQSTLPTDPPASPDAEESPTGGSPQSEPVGGSYRIPVPSTKGGKPDYRAWSKALLQPKLRQAEDAAQLAHLLGEHEETLEACRKGGLDAADLKELQQAISAAWDRCPA